MNDDNREIVGGISLIVGCELVLVIVTIMAAAVGANIHRITETIAAWEMFN